MTARMKEGINTNSVLIIIVIALSTWTLKKVSELSETQALLLYRVQVLEQAALKRSVSTAHPQGASSAMSPVLGQLSPSSLAK